MEFNCKSLVKYLHKREKVRVLLGNRTAPLAQPFAKSPPAARSAALLILKHRQVDGHAIRFLYPFVLTTIEPEKFRTSNNENLVPQKKTFSRIAFTIFYSVDGPGAL